MSNQSKGTLTVGDGVRVGVGMFILLPLLLVGLLFIGGLAGGVTFWLATRSTTDQVVKTPIPEPLAIQTARADTTPWDCRKYTHNAQKREWCISEHNRLGPWNFKAVEDDDTPIPQEMR
jgi:uncharacterized protein YneF (UPF0154 family)